MSAKNECVRLIQEIAIVRDIFCRAPGCNNLATCGHHIFPRARLATAFDPRYIVGMCVFCHVPWAHAHPFEFQEWVISWMGREEYEKGQRLSNTIIKFPDYDQIRLNLREFKQSLRGVNGIFSV